MADDEEKLQLRADVERYKRMIRQKDEMIEEMEQELTRGKTPVRNDDSREREKELNGQIHDLQMELETRNQTVAKKEKIIEELRDELDKVEKSYRELMDTRSICNDGDESNSFLESEMIRISEELEKYKETASQLLEKNLEYEKECLQLKCDYESAMEHVSSLESHLKTREDEISRLEGEIFDMKASGQGKFASAGNSIFAEAMDAEQKLEEDLKRVFYEKKYLSERVKRLELEKEDAEERVRNAMRRGNAVRTAIGHVDNGEMQRLRQRVHELESERVHLFERFFLKIRGVPKRELGVIVCGHIESFKLSIASIKGGYDELAKKNEICISTLNGSQKENEDLRSKIEQLEFDVETLRKYKERFETNFANAGSQSSDSQNNKLNAPLKPLKPQDKERMTFFVKRPEVAPEVDISKMCITPQKPADVSTVTTEKKENTSAWVEQRQRVKEQKKQASATPFKPFNFVRLDAPSTSTMFKPATLQMPATPSEK